MFRIDAEVRAQLTDSTAITGLPRMRVRELPNRTDGVSIATAPTGITTETIAPAPEAKPPLEPTGTIFEAGPAPYLGGRHVGPDTDRDPLETNHATFFYPYERTSPASKVVTRPNVEAERIARMQGKRANPVTGYRTR